MQSNLNKKNKNQKGATLLLAIMLLGLIFVMGAAIAKIQLKELKLGTKEAFSTKALFAADSGIERALYKIYQEAVTLPATCTTTGCYIPESDLGNGANYHVTVPRGDDNPVAIGTSTEYIILRSNGSFQGVERSLEVNLYKKIPST